MNVYLIEDDPLTLVDAGPNSGTSFDVLQRGIADLGHALEDIELVVLTHQHIDHLGLVSLVAAHSGAEVAVIDAAVPFVENFSVEAQAEDDFARDVMLRHGIGEDVAAALQSVSRAFRAWGARVEVTRVLHDGDRIELRDRTFEVAFRPGHSPSDTVFWDRERGHLIAGDHLLGAHLLEPPDHAQARRVRRALAGARSPTSTRCARRARWTWSWCCPATATRSWTTGA